MIDLHIHTTESDGGCSPQEIVYLAREKKLQAVAITDHDSIDGVGKAMDIGTQLGIEVIPGVELSAKNERGLFHILGYFVDFTNPLLRDSLRALRDDKHEEFQELLNKLRTSPVCSPLRCYVSSPVRSDSIKTPLSDSARQRDDAASLRLAGKRYQPKANLNPEDAVQLIKAVGGVPVVAHPYSLLRFTEEDWNSIVERLVACGIQGIEAYYPVHTPAQTGMFLRSAREYDLAVTGGSDFHGRIHRIDGKIKNAEELGCIPGWELDYKLVLELRRRAESNRAE